MGETEEAGKCGRGGGIRRAAAMRKGHWEVVGKEDWTDGGRGVPEVWGRRADSGPQSVPVREDPKNEGRKGKERMAKGKRDEVGQLGQLGWVSIKEVGEDGGIGPCRR